MLTLRHLVSYMVSAYRLAYRRRNKGQIPTAALYQQAPQAQSNAQSPMLKRLRALFMPRVNAHEQNDMIQIVPMKQVTLMTC